MTNMCPVCAYPDLYEPAYNGRVASQEICPSCGFQFGWSDKDQGISYAQWREQWINRGMQWRGDGIKEPQNWDPQQQLLNIGVKV